jgi:hypothetical protein
MSMFYLTMVIVPLLIYPFSGMNSIFEIIDTSNIFLGPLQGIVAAILVTFFSKRPRVNEKERS